MDYKACMVDEDNVDDILTLAWFKSWLNLKNITNQESKIKKPGIFEVHDQYITELGLQFLVNAFENFLEANADTLEVTSETDAVQLILDFLEESGIKYYFDPESSEEKDKYDDLLSYCRDLCSRTVLSIVSDKLEEESDAVGLRSFRISMILYFLNRKQDVQDSKYAYSLLLDLVLELSASERTRQRMDNLVCVNVKGKPGEGIHRDKKCEHFVKEVKNALKGTHSNLKDLTVDKTVTSLSVINRITTHDLESMLSNSLSSNTSYDYIGEEKKKIMADKISEINPFSKNRMKFDFYDKSRGSPFAGMSIVKIDKFVVRNCGHFKRRFKKIT